MTLEEAQIAVAENRRLAPEQTIWRHCKSGNEYVVERHAIIEATLEPAVIYVDLYDTGKSAWCRPATEFLDGRFKRES